MARQQDGGVVMTGEPGATSSTALKRLAQEIRGRRKAADLSQPKLASMIAYSRQYVSQAENPDRGLPSAELVTAIDTALEADGALVALRKQAQVEVYALRNGLLDMAGAAHHAVGGYVGGQEDDEDMKRRTLLGLGPAALMSPLVSRLEELRQGLDGVLRTEPTVRDADDWEQVAADYANEVGTVPAVQILDELVADFTEIHHRIGAAGGLVRTQLLHAGTQLAALTAIALVTLGVPRSAERWWRTAARAAQEANDPQLIALVHGRHAVFSLYSAPTSRVLALAEAAIETAKSSACAGAISGLAAKAQILAEDGHGAEALKATQAVADMYERLPSTTTANQRGQWSWSEQRLRHVQTHVHAHAGQLSETFDAQRAALACYPCGNFQGPAQVRLYGATALIKSGDVRSGADRVVEIIERLADWQQHDGLILKSAQATLKSMPSSHLTHPRVAGATELVASLVGGR